MKRTIDLKTIPTYHPAVVAERILIITDVEADGQLVRNALDNAGFSTLVRAGNTRAIDAIDTEQIALLVLDARTEDVPAADLCKLARTSPRGAVIPILFLGTGKEVVKTSADAIALGADLLFLVDSEIHQLVRKCIHYLGEPPRKTPDITPDPSLIDGTNQTNTPTEKHAQQTSDWGELDRLLVSEQSTGLGELGASKGTNPDLDLLVSQMAPDLDLPSMATGSDVSSQQPSVTVKADKNAAIGLKIGHAVDLNERGLGNVLFTAQRLQLSGRVEIASNGVLRRVFFDEGRPVYIDSSSSDEDLVASLVQEGILTSEQLNTARRTGRELNLSPEEVLIDTAQVSPEDIQQCLQTHVERRLIELFALESGESVVIQGGPRPIDPVTLEKTLSRLVLDGIRRKYGRLRLYRVFGTGSIIPQRGTVAEAECKLTTSEESVLNRIDGKTTINGIARSTGLGETECLALVYGLSILRLIDVPKATRNPGGALALPSSQYAFANPPLTHDARPGFAELVSRKHRQVLYADYYTVLGIGRDANRAEIEASYKQLEIQFDPNRVREDSPLRKAVDDIAQVLKDAVGILTRAEWREKYEQALDQSTTDR